MHQEEDAGLEKVRLFFQLHGDSRFARWDQAADRAIIQRAGFKKQDDEGTWEFYVFSEVFKTEICKEIDPKYTAKICIKHGLLLPSSDNKTTRRERLPGIGPTRCYRFTSKVLNEYEEHTKGKAIPSNGLQDH